MSAVSIDVGNALAAAINYKSQANSLAYQKQLNKLQMQREDTAYQRAVSDAMQAGLSPLAVSGTSGAASGALTAGNAPQFALGGSASANLEIDSRRLRMEESAVLSSNAKNAAETSKANAEAEAQMTANKYQEAQILNDLKQQSANLDNTLADTSLKGASREKILNEKKYVQQQIAESEARVKQIQQDITFRAQDKWRFDNAGLPFTHDFPSGPLGMVGPLYPMMNTANRGVKAVGRGIKSVGNAVKSSVSSAAAYKQAVAEWKSQLERTRQLARSSPSSRAASSYISTWLKNNPKPKRSDF